MQILSNNNEWTQKQLEFLKTYYKEYSIGYFCDMFNMSGHFIYKKLQELNLKRSLKVKTSFFRPEEIQFLKNNINNMTDQELTNEINNRFCPPKHTHGLSAIIYLRKQLNLVRQKRIVRNPRGKWTKQDNQIFIDNCYYMEQEELANYLKRTSASISHRFAYFKLGYWKASFMHSKAGRQYEKFLRQYFYTMPLNDISKQLQVPAIKLLVFAQELGLLPIDNSLPIYSIDLNEFDKQNNIIINMFSNKPFYDVLQATNLPVKRLFSRACFLKLIDYIPLRTAIELFIDKELQKLNIPFKIQQSFCYDFGKWYSFDFMLYDNILLEIQGDYFHVNPETQKEKALTDTQKKALKKDREKLKWATSNGYKVYYIWENDIKHNKNQVIDFLKTLIK